MCLGNKKPMYAPVQLQLTITHCLYYRSGEIWNWFKTVPDVSRITRIQKCINITYITEMYIKPEFVTSSRSKNVCVHH